MANKGWKSKYADAFIGSLTGIGDATVKAVGKPRVGGNPLTFEAQQAKETSEHDGLNTHTEATPVDRAVASGDASALAADIYMQERADAINKAEATTNPFAGATTMYGDIAKGLFTAGKVESALDPGKLMTATYDNRNLSRAVTDIANHKMVEAMTANPKLSAEDAKKVYNKEVEAQLTKANNAITNRLIADNAPKNEADYIAKNLGTSLVGSLTKGAANAVAGYRGEGEEGIRQAALADYGENKATWWGKGTAGAASLVLDTLPFMGAGLVGNQVGRGASWLGSRLLGKYGTQTLASKALTGVAASAGTFGTYDAANALAQQFATNQYDAKAIGESALHGMGTGASIGWVSPFFRGASATMGKAGKATMMAGGLGTEIGVFAAPEIKAMMESGNPYELSDYAEVLGTNAITIGGLKLANAKKSIDEYKGWYNEGKQGKMTDADYKMMADYARANGYANDQTFTMSADGTYKRNVLDQLTGNRNSLSLVNRTNTSGRTLAEAMLTDGRVPRSLRTKIAAQVGAPAPSVVLANGSKAEGNKFITTYTYVMPDGSQRTEVIDVQECASNRQAKSRAMQFARTAGRVNDVQNMSNQVDAMATSPVVAARLAERAKANGTSVAEEQRKMQDVQLKAMMGEASQDEVNDYRNLTAQNTAATDAMKVEAGKQFGVDIDKVLAKREDLNTAESDALDAYSAMLRSTLERQAPKSAREAEQMRAGVEDFAITTGASADEVGKLMADPSQAKAVAAQQRANYSAYIDFVDGNISEPQLAQRLGIDTSTNEGMMHFAKVLEYYQSKGKNYIASRIAEEANRLIDEGANGGVQFLSDGRVKVAGINMPVEVDKSISERYQAALQGAEPMQDVVRAALYDVAGKALAEPKAESKAPEVEAPDMEMPDIEAPEHDAIMQEPTPEPSHTFDGMEIDGVQTATINDKPVLIIKGEVKGQPDGTPDRQQSSAEIAYVPLDEDGEPIRKADGKLAVEVGAKPSNLHITDIGERMALADYEASKAEERSEAEAEATPMETPEAEPQEITDPTNTDELMQMCEGDKDIALAVAMSELEKAMKQKGKGTSVAETVAIEKAIRRWSKMVDEMQKEEAPKPEAEVKEEAKQEVEAPQGEVKPEEVEAPQAEQTVDDAESKADEDPRTFVDQPELNGNHEGMTAVENADGTFRYVGLQRGEASQGMDAETANLIDGIATRLGLPVVAVNDSRRAVNGYIKDGVVYINTNRADSGVDWISGHEFLHEVEKASPDAYEAYKAAVLKMWGSDYVKRRTAEIVADYKAVGVNIDEEQAQREMVNDYGGELFSSQDGLKIMKGIVDKAASGGEMTLLQRISGWWQAVKDFVVGKPYYREVEGIITDAYAKAIDEISGTAEITPSRVQAEELAHTKDYEPSKNILSGESAIDGQKTSTEYSVSSIANGGGLAASIEGDRVVFRTNEGRVVDREHPLTVDEVKKDSALSMMIETSRDLHLIDESKIDDYYKVYTDIINKYVEKAEQGVADFTRQYLWKGETVYKTVHNNSDKQYTRSLDVTLVCKKNEAVIRGISELQKRQGYGVTPGQILKLYEESQVEGFQVPCPVCYVFSRYINNGQYQSNLIAGHTKYDNNPYNDASLANASVETMTKEERAKYDKAVKFWTKELTRLEKEADENEKITKQAKQVLSYTTLEIDAIAKKILDPNTTPKEAKTLRKRVEALDKAYRASLNLVAQADMLGYVKNTIAAPVYEDGKIVSVEFRPYIGAKMDEGMYNAILDYRETAAAMEQYPSIIAYRNSKGSSTGKQIAFESDCELGAVFSSLNDQKNSLVEAVTAVNPKKRASALNTLRKNASNNAVYAARQMLRGGIRQWSWSDNVERLAPDVIMNALQVELLGGGIQAYSKQLEGIEMMAGINAYINGSLMGRGIGFQRVSASYNKAPKWRDPVTGYYYTLVFDNVVGVEPYSRNGKKGLFELNEMYDRAGNILVGMNDIHIRTALSDPRIFFVIPWHASGMSNHILRQMFNILGIPMKGFKATDYTDMQEEKMYGDKGIPEDTIELWNSHNYAKDYLNKDGSMCAVEVGDGKLSASQLHYRELRNAIMGHSISDKASDADKEFWAKRPEWLKEIENDEFLSQALKEVTDKLGKYGVAMQADDKKFIYPYEYWNTNSRIENAGENTHRYLEYCRRLGVRPKFSGVGANKSKGYFIDDAGYWKLLVDRRMYDTKGNYQALSAIDVSKFNPDWIDQAKTSERFDVSRVADAEATARIVDKVQADEGDSFEQISGNQQSPYVDYDKTYAQVIKEANAAIGKYTKTKEVKEIDEKGKVTTSTDKEEYAKVNAKNEAMTSPMEEVNDDVVDSNGTYYSIRNSHGEDQRVADTNDLTPTKLSEYGTVSNKQTPVADLPKDMAYRETDINELRDILESGGMRAIPEGVEVEGARRTFKTKSGRSFVFGKAHGNAHGGKGFSKGAPWSTLGGTLTRGTADKVIIGVEGDTTEWQQGHHGSYSKAKPFAEIEDGKPLFLRFDEDGKVAGVGVDKMRFWLADADGKYHEFVPKANGGVEYSVSHTEEGESTEAGKATESTEAGKATESTEAKKEKKIPRREQQLLDRVETWKTKYKELKNTKDAKQSEVKKLAKEMTDFINTSVPSKVQKDMQRHDFTGILKALGEATTTQQLEQPIKAVDRIGTYVINRHLRRSLVDILAKQYHTLDNKGVAKHGGVDSHTRHVMEYAKKLYYEMLDSGVGSEIWGKQKDRKKAVENVPEQYRTIVNEILNGKSKDKDANDPTPNEVRKKFDALKNSGKSKVERLREYLDVIDEYLKPEGVLAVNPREQIEDVIEIQQALGLKTEEGKQKLMSAAGKAVEDIDKREQSLNEKEYLTEDEKVELESIPLLRMLADIRQRNLDINGVGSVNDNTTLQGMITAERNNLAAIRKEKANTDAKKKLKAERISKQKELIATLEAEQVEKMKSLNADIERVVDDFSELVKTGKSKLKEWSKAKQERKKAFAALGVEAFGIKKKNSPNGFETKLDAQSGIKKSIVDFYLNAKQFVLSPALSFEYMCSVINPDYYTGESPIYNTLIKGEHGLIHINDEFFKSLERFDKEVLDAIHRFIGKSKLQGVRNMVDMGELIVDRDEVGKIPFYSMQVLDEDGSVLRPATSYTHRIKRGQAAKIYTWWQSEEGRAKLEAQGVTEDTIKAIEGFIGEGYKEFCNWVIDEFFPKLRRERYNKVHEAMQGTSLGESEHYFPFLIYKNDIWQNQGLETINNDSLNQGSPGNIKERKRNSARLDFTDESPDIFDMITQYGRTMEEWANYAQVREDVANMVNNKTFRTLCEDFGSQYYQRFLNAAKVALRLQDETTLSKHDDKFLSKLNKAFASGAVSWRVSTALKQLLSFPAFIVYSPNLAYQYELLIRNGMPAALEKAIQGVFRLAKGDTKGAKSCFTENWIGHYNWCVKNLPSFRERVQAGGAGNPILEDKGFYWVDVVSTFGMYPNRIIDAFTCSLGAKAVYEFEHKKYLKAGMTEEEAHKMAVIDAEIAFNTSQQSSNPSFLSPIQTSTNIFWRSLMNFKNSVIGYMRNGLKANIDAARAVRAMFGRLTYGANHNSFGKLNHSILQSLMFNLGLNFLWNFGTIGVGGLSSTMLGTSDNKEGLYTDEEFAKGALGDNWMDIGKGLMLDPLQGNPILYGVLNAYNSGSDWEPMIWLSELNDFAKDASSDGISLPLAQLITGVLIRTGVGINPETAASIYEGCMQIIQKNGDASLEDLMKLMASPRSAMGGVAKQRALQYDNMQDYVDNRITAERRYMPKEAPTFFGGVIGKRGITANKVKEFVDDYISARVPEWDDLMGVKSEDDKKNNRRYSLVEELHEKKKNAKPKTSLDDPAYYTKKDFKFIVNKVEKLYITEPKVASKIVGKLLKQYEAYQQQGTELKDMNFLDLRIEVEDIVTPPTK